MASEIRHFPLAIIGSGPAGCTAALYAARANLEPLVFMGLEPGGQLTTTTDVDNWPADDDGVQGPALMERFMRHSTRFGGERISDHIKEVDLESRPMRIVGREEYSCDAMVIATGASAKYLGLDSEERYKGRGVSACATCDGFFFRDKEVLVVGGGNTAVEEALFLAGLCSKVTVIHRREEFRAEAIMQTRLREAEESGKIEIRRWFVLDEVLGDGAKVTGARIKDVRDNGTEDVEVSGVFIAIGHQPNTGLFSGQVEMDGGYVITKAGINGMATATSADGVFAAGDVQDRVYRQAVTSAASGCMAALDAVRYLKERGSVTGKAPSNSGKEEETFVDIVATDESLLDNGLRPKDPEGEGDKEPTGGILGPYAPRQSFDGSVWRAHGYQERRMKRMLGKGPEAKHDYHGYKTEEAWRELDGHLAADIHHGRTVVEVIHGKGAGVLKNKMRAWLKACPCVLGFSEVGGNKGSVVVVLKEKK